ncbi:MAG: hypothetical protein M2R46_05064 [Verrucomicrobia subdivision 3 bacterium]|nr:hypothetical protein [Limisphaerales bacterium]
MNETEGLPLFSPVEIEHRRAAMSAAIAKTTEALETLGKGDPWGDDVKASDDFLTPLFKNYFQELELPNLMAKRRFHELAQYVPDEDINSEIKEKLNAIAEVADSASSEA